MKNIHKYKLVLVIASALLIGCEEDQDPITSNTMTVVVNSLNTSDINDQGILEKDENISNDSGNPWGEFIKDAEAELGREPERFEIISASMQLTDRDGVDSFDELISGKMSARILSTQGSDDDALKVEIGSKMNPSGESAIELSDLASASELNILHERLLGGDFHVGFNGETDLTKDNSFSVDVIIKFVVRAY